MCGLHHVSRTYCESFGLMLNHKSVLCNDDSLCSWFSILFAVRMLLLQNPYFPSVPILLSTAQS